MCLDGIGQAPAQPRFRGLGIPAECQHNASLRRIDNVEATGQPDQQHQYGQRADTAAKNLEVHWRTGGAVAAIVTIAAPTLLAEQAGKSAIEIAPQIFEIGGALVRPISPLGIVQ